MTCFDRSLLRLMPPALRARDFHLYLEGGKRITDLWRFGGKAVLGHKPPRVLSELKNAAERGLFTPLPHPLEKRLLKALVLLFPGRSFRLYIEESSLQLSVTNAGLDYAQVPLWRPFLGELTDSVTITVMPWPQGPAVLVLPESLEKSFPSGDLIPPLLLAPAVRAIYNLAAILKTFDPGRDWPNYPKIKKALANGIWRHQGIYLTLKQNMDKTQYETLFRRFLEGGFLLPPSPEEPAILPFTMSAGEEAKLAELLGGKN